MNTQATRHVIRVKLENGDHFDTEINGTIESVLDYYVGKFFNFGIEGDNMQKVKSVSFWDGEEFLEHKRKNHKHYDLAYRAHYKTSFSPDKRALSACAGFDSDIRKLEGLGVPVEKIAKYESLWIKWMQAKGRCLSSMITGPANFPVRRNEKANNVERARGDEALKYFNALVSYAEKEAYYAANPNARPVMAGDEDAIERLKSKLEAYKAAHESMIQVNKIVRKKPLDMAELIALLGSEDKALSILKPDYAGRIGFAGYALTNSNAEIKRLEGRIKEIENRKASTPKELNINGARIVENTEAMRLQIFFDGKPNAAIIALLKSNAFKWAPSVMAWQRQLTNNAIYSVNHFVIPKLKELTA